MDIREIKSPEPKYIEPEMYRRRKEPFLKQLEALQKYLYIQPGDPWVLCNDTLSRLPVTPDGIGLSMNVPVFPVIRLLGFGLRYDTAAQQWIPFRIEDDQYSEDDESPSYIKTIAEIVIPLKLGVVITSNGSVYIAERRELAKLDPPELDDDYVLIMHPYRDEDLFDQRMITDEWGFARPDYDSRLAIRSLALSKASYSMRIKPFIMDGWLDYTLIHEGEIKATADDWNLEPSTAKQFLSTVRQLISSQSAKAVVMGRPTSDGKAVINITFTGTKHTPDWLNNIKVSVTNKLHRGFYELVSQFDSLIGEIHLKRLASTLGLKDLTLPEIISEASRKDSRYKLWITGHSQGGALTQVYIAEFLMKKGVLPENIFAYTYASPIVATSEYCDDPGNFPIYNIVNADDFACRVGSAVRLGVDLMFFPDEDFRKANYEGYADAHRRGMYDDILKLCYWMTDSFKFGEYMIAMTTFAAEYPSGRNLIEWIEGVPVLKSLYNSFKDRTDIPAAIHDRMYKMLEKPYMEVGGVPPSEERITLVRNFLEILYAKWGTECLMDYMVATHQIPSNYSEIVLLPRDNLVRAVWFSERPARLIGSEGEELMRPVEFPYIEDTRRFISLPPENE